MMDDLAIADFETAEAAVEAFDAAYAPLLTNYIVGRGGMDPAQTNPIRLEREGDEGFETPTSLFMIYLKFDDAGKLIARQLRFNDFGSPANGNRTLDQAEDDLLTEARLGAGTHLERSNFQGMTWQRPYYVTFVIDNAGWQFYWSQAALHEAIRFLERKDEPGNFKTYESENHTFFDAKDDIPLASLGDAFRVVNYYRDQNGPIVAPAVKREYCFEIYLQAIFKDPAGVGQPTHITVLIDPDGQNQGPRT